MRYGAITWFNSFYINLFSVTSFAGCLTMHSVRLSLIFLSICCFCNLVTFAATSCDAGSYLDDSNCYPCPPSSYCPDGYRKLDCNIGEYQNSFSASSCTSCQDGWYTTETGSVTCNICPRGFMCPNNDRDPIPCPPGTYQSSYGSTRCLQCTAGETDRAD